MKPIYFLLTAAFFLASGCSHAEIIDTEAAEVEAGEVAGGAEAADQEETASGLPAVQLTPRLLYQFLLAEIASQRGQIGNSADLYLDLAKQTRDPRIARRAAEIAAHARRMDVAMQATQLWLEIEPASISAKVALVNLLVSQGRYAELKVATAALLSAEPQQVGQNLLRLNRLFASAPDRKAVRDLIETVTAPYLQLPEAHYVRAVTAFENRDLGAAQAAIDQALQIKPDWGAGVLLRAQMLEKRAALALLEEFISAYPQAREVRLVYARALVGEKRYAEARRHFGILLEQSASTPEKNGDLLFAAAVLSMQLNDSADAETLLRQLAVLGHVEADKAHFYLGQIAGGNKQLDEALRWFSLVGQGEHYLSARLQAANLLAGQGKIEEARQLLAESQANNLSERVQLLIGESQLLREAGKFTAAHAALTAGLDQQPDQPELLYEIALIAEKLGRIDELESRLRRLIALKPDHAHAHNALGYSFADRNIHLAEARKLIDRALELAPNDPLILDSKGWVLFRLGENQAALDVLTNAFSMRTDPEIAAHLGEVLWALNRKDEARQTWEKARREHPSNEVLAETIKRLAP
jgi:predicted Zn-dependent protease